MAASSRKARLALTLTAAVVVAAAAVVGVRALTKNAPPRITPTCTAAGYDLTTSQASVAAQMIGAVYKSGVSHQQRAGVLVLAAALQESKLANIAPGAGDRDSVGVLQQRPSQDWGKARTDGEADTIAARTQRLTDVTEATREFLVKLQNFPSWWTLPAATAIQNVQISADGSLYAQHEPMAKAFSDALLGISPAGVTCAFEPPTEVSQAAKVADDLKYQLGITTPTTTAQAIRVPAAGWQTAAWFVANADRRGIASVEYAAHTWTRKDGWQPSEAPSSSVLAVMAPTPK